MEHNGVIKKWVCVLGLLCHSGLMLIMLFKGNVSMSGCLGCTGCMGGCGDCVLIPYMNQDTIIGGLRGMGTGEIDSTGHNALWSCKVWTRIWKGLILQKNKTKQPDMVSVKCNVCENAGGKRRARRQLLQCCWAAICIHASCPLKPAPESVLPLSQLLI